MAKKETEGTARRRLFGKSRSKKAASAGQISRRGFLKTAGLTAAGLGAAIAARGKPSRATGATTVQDHPTYFAAIFLTFHDEETGYLSAIAGFNPDSWELRPYLNESNEVTLPDELGVCPVCTKDISTFMGTDVPTIVYHFGQGDFTPDYPPKQLVFEAFFGEYIYFTSRFVDAYYGDTDAYAELKTEFQNRFGPISDGEFSAWMFLVPIRIALFDFRAGYVLSDRIAAMGKTTQKIMAQTVEQKFAAAHGEGKVQLRDGGETASYKMSTTGFMQLFPIFAPPDNIPPYPQTYLPGGTLPEGDPAPYPAGILPAETLFSLYPSAIPDIGYPPSSLKVTLK